MLISIGEIDFTRKLSFVILLLCIYFSLKNPNAETKKGSSSATFFPGSRSSSHRFMSNNIKMLEFGNLPQSLQYDFYRDSCPDAERIVRAQVHHLFRISPNVAPALLRLVFHDCFIEGCDASVLLDSINGITSEKESIPNQSLKGFDIIDTIKSELEQICPGIVSCSDVLVLAARDAAVLAGAPFYPLNTGRRDSSISFPEIATYELPSPHANLHQTLRIFSSRGFDARETVSLLGAHSIGKIHCKFFKTRLHNFRGTDSPDPSLDPEFLDLMRSKCESNQSSELSPSIDGSSSSLSLPEELGIEMAKGSSESEFGELYYHNLLKNRGILYADQQLMSREETGIWVRAYVSDPALFRRDFALSMFKLSNFRVLTQPMGQIRLSCSKVV